MFGRRKEEYQMLQKSIESMENSQKSTELMISAFCNMIESQKEQEIAKKEEEEVSDEEKRRAAYALNLCTVSISQIIDYNDENILEQEYETILNNLNLENMPKDEALLNILKQILDTVTFFRIQDGEKAFIEKEYQHKMKNAIWAGVPNFGLIVAGGNPFTVALSLASQVGIGYMNYRKAMAENDLNKEKQDWQLQRAAIEQLNGLRRELFDASWRLADRYGFKDEYRLTERQITQYNKILMDADDYRRYERLEAVSQYFVAYPSFWYHFGHAANCIAQKAIKDDEPEVYDKYREFAIEHFEKFMNSDKYALLREDQITSSCALEYIDLLNIETDKDKIKQLLDRAIKMSGQACDILQLCAIDYLRISDINSAVSILKYLVNENYNAVTNAQLLSSLYVSGIIEMGNTSLIADYKILKKKIPSEMLFPLPEENESIDDLKDNFITKQQEVLYQRYAYVIRNYYEKCTVIFNKCIPAPYEDKTYPDIFYSDIYDRREERLNQYKTLFSNKNKAEDYIVRLTNSNFALGFLDTFNEMANGIENILPGTDSEKQQTILELVSYVEAKITERKKLINDIQERLNGNFGSKDFEALFSLSFESFTKEFLGRLVMIIKTHIAGITEMSQFSKEETMLREFCIEQGIPEFKNSVNLVREEYDEYTGNKIYFSSELLGGAAFETSEMISIARKMAKHIDDSIQKVIPESKKQKTFFYTKWNKLLKGDFEEYFRGGRKKYYSNKDLRNKIIAVLVDNSLGIGNPDLVFTTEGLFCDKAFTCLTDSPVIVEYSKVELDNNKLKIGTDNYKNKEVNLFALFDLIQEMAEMATTINASGTQNTQYISYNDTYMIESSTND